MALYHFYLGPSQKTINEAFESLSEEEYSLEGFSLSEAKEKLKKLITKVREVIRNVFKKILKFIQKGFSYLIGWFKNDQKKFEMIQRILDDKDKLVLYKKAIMSMYTRTPPIVNHDGSLIDLDQFEKDKDWYLKQVEDGTITPFKEFSQTCYIVRSNYLESNGIIVTEPEQLKGLTVKSVENLFNLKTMDRLEREISKQKLPNQISDFEKTLNDKSLMAIKAESENKHFIQVQARTMRMVYSLRNILAIYQCLVLFFKSTMSEFLKKDIFIEPFLKSKQKNKTLIHLSGKELTDNILYPRYPGDVSELAVRKVFGSEVLPKRVSFSPTIQEAVLGIHHHVSGGRIIAKNGEIFIDVYIYEGIPDKNTFVIKEKYTEALIFDWNDTHEIVVVKNPIRVKKVNKIRVYLEYIGESSKNASGTLTHEPRYRYLRHVVLPE